MGRSCPLHNAQPFGAKTKLMMRISERNGSAMFFYSQRVSRNYFHTRRESRPSGGNAAKLGKIKSRIWYYKFEAARILCASFKDCKHIFCRPKETRRINRLRRLSQ